MSKTHNQTVKYWEDLECKLLAGNASNCTLPEDDKKLVIRALILNSSIVCDYLSPFLADPLRLLVPSIISMLKNDIVEVAKAFKVCLNGLLQLKEGEDVSAYLSGFKSQSSLCEWGIVISPLVSLYRVTDGKQFHEGVATSIQFLSGWSRIKLRSLDYTQDCIKEYLADEARLQSLVIPKVVTGALNHILKEWLAEFPIDNLCDSNMSHGPGASAFLGRGSILDKYALLHTDSRINYCIPYSGINDYPSYTERTCEVVFVPKSLLSWRTISMEPPYLMYLQQSGLQMLAKWFHYQPTLNQVIHLENSEVNREAARLASQPGNTDCTIDLSSASDSVSWSLIKAVFRGTPLLKLFYAMRSDKASIKQNGEEMVISLNKFAPMGSAICFPVECMIFALICELAQRMCGDLGKPKYLVYGDDIVLPLSMRDRTLDLLECCGFRVNHSKSFMHPNVAFRESCGGEYWNGLDVTPLRLPRNFAYATRGSLLVSPAIYDQTVSLTNMLFVRKFRVARSLVLKHLLSLPKTKRPLFGPYIDGLEEYNYVVTTAPTNLHLVSYLEQDLRKDLPFYGGMVVVHGRTCPRGRESIFEHHHSFIEAVKLHEWYRNTLVREEVIDPFSPVVERTDSTLRTVRSILT